MTASETGREIPADVRALTRSLRLMPDKARLAGAFEADCYAAADLIEAQAARIASLEAERARTVEECARVVQSGRTFSTRRGGYVVIGREAEDAIADAIRALAPEKGGQADG